MVFSEIAFTKDHLFSILLVELALIPIRPEQQARNPGRCPAHLITDRLQGYTGAALDDKLVVDAAHDELEHTLRELDERLNREADAVQELIATNARVAQNQDEYNERYDALVSTYEATKKERDRVAAEIRQKGIRRREFQRFITALENLPEEVTEFEEGMWSDLVECLAVYAKDDLRFTLPCGTEITA